MSAEPIAEAERVDWLRLARAESVGPVTFAHLIGRFGSASRALAALPDLSKRGGRPSPPRVLSLAEAQRELDAGAAIGARLLTLRDPAFPRLLAGNESKIGGAKTAAPS